VGDYVLQDPIQVAADAREHGRKSHLAAHGGAKGSGPDQVAGVALLVDQRAAGIAVAGGLAAGGAHADHLLRDSTAPVHPAQSVRHHGHLHVPQNGRDRFGGITVTSPAGGKSSDGFVGGKLAVQTTRQIGSPYPIVETHKGGQVDERDVVDHRAGRVVGVHYNARFLDHDPLLTLLRLIVDVDGAQIDRYGLRSIHAVGRCDYPVV